MVKWKPKARASCGCVRRIPWFIGLEWLLTKNWAAQAEWSTESRSPRAPPEKPWDQLKLLRRCAQFLRWLDRVKVTADKDDGETHESFVDVMDIGKYIIYKMQLRRNAVLGMSIFLLGAEFMVLSPVLHPNRHPIKRFDLISTDTCLDFPCTFCLKLTQAITWKVSFMKQVCLKLLVWLLQFSFLLKWHEMFQITYKDP